jgi:hypothetical protein
LELIHDISLLLLAVVNGLSDSSAGAPPPSIVRIVRGCFCQVASLRCPALEEIGPAAGREVLVFLVAIAR